MTRRPPPLRVDDDAPVRRDVDSDDVRRVHPELSNLKASSARHAHLQACDERAYERVRTRFPLLTPPWSSDCDDGPPVPAAPP